MQFRVIDVEDPHEFGCWYAIIREAELFERPDAPMWSAREFHVALTGSDDGESVSALGMFDGTDILAAALTVVPLLDNLDKANLFVYVVPSRRRQGIGGALVEHLVSSWSLAGRTSMLAESWLPLDAGAEHPYRRFARRHGFAPANVEIRRVLPLPVPEATLRAWAAEAGEHHRDYRIQTFVDDVPSELLESYCHLRNQLSLDAPTGDVGLEARAFTPEIVLRRHAVAKEQGRTTYLALAVEPGGDAVAYTSLIASADEPEYAHQAGTLVRRDHRGHRLGQAVKVANLVSLQEGSPHVRFVDTENGETNGPMVRINEKLGFRPVELLEQFQRIVSAATASVPE